MVMLAPGRSEGKTWGVSVTAEEGITVPTMWYSRIVHTRSGLASSCSPVTFSFIRAPWKACVWHGHQQVSSRVPGYALVCFMPMQGPQGCLAGVRRASMCRRLHASELGGSHSSGTCPEAAHMKWCAARNAWLRGAWAYLVVGREHSDSRRCILRCLEHGGAGVQERCQDRQTGLPRRH